MAMVILASILRWRSFTMTTREPECVVLKRRGAEYVAQLLAGKSKQEELEFWGKRTESLRSRQKPKTSKSEQVIV